MPLGLLQLWLKFISNKKFRNETKIFLFIVRVILRCHKTGTAQTVYLTIMQKGTVIVQIVPT